MLHKLSPAKLMRTILLFVLILVASMPARSQQALKPEFSHPGIIRYDHDAFIIHGKDTFIFSGSFHYFRSDPTQWMSILRKIKAAGFNTIQTYVPWNFHEQVEGKPNFSLLEKFLGDCQRMGLYVTIRVGPYVCGEWDEGGFPHWLAGKGIGFRTASPQDIYWSRYWYNEVLPVVRKHLITNGGSIILLQIENEYNYFGFPDTQKVEYLKSLYQDVMRNHIDVPIITCWTQQVRDKTDSVFSQIMDAGDFYPGWNLKATLPRLELLKQQQPYSPPFITELQGGWFTGIRDMTVRHVNKYGPGQINALTKYMIAHGIKGLNYYMLYGGTNFGYWAGKGKTTSYDYTAPISECGGLWPKYYAVKLIGDFMGYAQPYLTRCHEVTGGAVSSNHGIETILRSDGKSGFLYAWNKTDESQNANIDVKMPGQIPFNISVPIEARDACLLPIDLPVPGGNLLHYSNVQLSTVTRCAGKPLLVAYGTPGEQAVIDWGSKIFTEPIPSDDQLYTWNGSYILLTSTNRASHGIVFHTRKGPAVLLSDSYFATAATHNRLGNLIQLQTRPGEDSLSLVVTGGVRGISLDGKPIAFAKSNGDKLIRFRFATPVFHTPKVKFGRMRYKMDTDADKNTYFRTVPSPRNGVYPSLDSMGDYQNGYSVYRGRFELAGDHMIKAGYYDTDWHSVFIDGKPVKGLTGSAFEDWSAVKLANGVHNLKVIYENEGRPNSGFMEEKKGLKSISVLSPGQIRTLEKWKYFVEETAGSGVNPPEANIDYDDSGWESVAVGHGARELVNRKQVGSWYRKMVPLTAQEANSNPRLIFEGVSRSAMVYVNGKLAYDFRHHGWNEPFSVSLNGIANAGTNLVAVYLENMEGKGGFVRPIVIEFGEEKPLTLLKLAYHAFLNGELAGWQRPGYPDTGWKMMSDSDSSKSGFGIKWYRTWFTVPLYRGWVVPWRVHIESTGNMQIWLNGKLLGRDYARGPQKDFYMPDGWLMPGRRNSLVLVMRPSGKGEMAPVLKDVSVSPYAEYVVQKHTLMLEQ